MGRLGNKTLVAYVGCCFVYGVVLFMMFSGVLYRCCFFFFGYFNLYSLSTIEQENFRVKIISQSRQKFNMRKKQATTYAMMIDD